MPEWEFLLPVPFYVKGKHAGKQVPFNSGNNYVSPMVRSYRTKRHREVAGSEAKRIRLALGLPAIRTRAFLDYAEFVSEKNFRYVHMTLVRGKRQRLLDTHQVYAATKPYLDALTDAEWIVDDKPRWCEFTASQTKDNSIGPAVLVRVSTL